MPREGIRAVVLAAAIGLALCGPGRAADAVYTVTGVKVDVTAESAAKAREQGLRKAHMTAFDRLMRRIVPRGRQAAVPDLGYTKVTKLVRSFEINTSRTSGVRYLGTLSFTFQRAAVRSLLRRHQIPFAETRSRPVVVLALYGERGDAVLWADPNPWRAAWADRADRRGLVPFAVPLGDLSDIQAISAGEARTHAREPLRAIARQYDAGDALVTRAVPAGNADNGGLSARIVATRITGKERPREIAFTVEQQDGESARAMYRRAAGRVARRITEAWKQANLLDFEHRQRIDVSVPLQTLTQWVRVERRLADVPVIARSAVRRMRRDAVRLRLTYFGETGQLETALTQNGLQLIPPKNPNEPAIVRLAGSVASPAIGTGPPDG